MLIGFAGLGRMGRPMATHLAAAGHTVLAYDPVTEQAPASVGLVDTAQALAATEISISMLPDCAATHALVTEALTDVAPGHLHIIMGTVGPAVVRELAALSWIDVVDAPVSGSVSMAEAATITTMVGASAAQFDRVQPVLAAMTARQFHAGPAGAGSTAKLAVNAVLAGLSQAVAEGVLLAEAGGLDPAIFYGILTNSAAGAPYVGYKQQAYLAPETTPVAAPVSLIRKDLGLALDLAHRHHLILPGAEAAFGVLDEAVAGGLASADMAEVLTALRRSNASALPEIPSPALHTGALS
ncbi:NAD(P)-dependent oxidoreductase [Nocardia bhagyanarayanae]|uniref:3-hydroxyisobutyrate dehydrogenase/2-hydroxy-3-oxopropionate reductase n=1 Tax=Nocardia bhagyanarayanae TaxID=1215925 RepID=A0A543FHN6_9NOCA|nr:NAD(P)-dependent oxidoreductase [Nocardia bhagyanarayanae]TQM33368.1 3-hydroxyisobutyrate dehydrogenase/2-hydroxy-3-oxopropionate reductase [Nocardia bhagyanarayanae]